MVSTNQHGSDEEYQTEAHRMLQTKSKPILLSITPMTLKNAQAWLGAYNELDIDDPDNELQNHFVTQAKLAKQREKGQ